MPFIDDYVTDVLLRDLVGHDRRPVSFFIYLWLAAQQSRKNGESVQISYSDISENTGVSRSSVQAAVSWLVRRKLLAVSRDNVTATPRYVVLSPWRKQRRGRNEYENKS
jgi:DNA-binding MarR family transcriptional regulator